tara:strand:- start:64 stop:240 length:177 start_codon:yes stop_codon:yes gene_type:complete
MNITSILVWLKVHNIANVQYQSQQDEKSKYYDFISQKHLSRNQIIKLAKQYGYKEQVY